MIHLSEAAKAEIKRIQTTRQQVENYLRISVEQGGCSGLYYILDWDETADERDRVYPQDDFSIVINEQSLPYLSHLTLDYTEDLMGGGFRFKNPQAMKTCSCGLSFALD